jgi:uncharacterized protein (DUF362 family)
MFTLVSNKVAIAAGAAQYPRRPPFDPPARYPEAPYPTGVDVENQVYPLVRETMRLLGMDASHYGRREWNPLGEVICPGDRVVIKPNFVLDRNYGRGPVEAVITHASVLRAIADYVLIALQGRGELIIADAPQMNCRWAPLQTANGIGLVAEHLRSVCTSRDGIAFDLRDLRQEETTYRWGIVWKRKRLRPPEARTIDVDLGDRSLLYGIDVSRLYGADYKRSTTVSAHRNHHRYRIAKELLNADVVISVPKLKVHSKVGTTLNIKNMVGINTDKNYLAHYRVGSASRGGDEFSNPAWDDLVDRWLMDWLLGRMWRVGKYPFVVWRAVRSIIRTIFPAKVRSFAYGNWHGNDTAWRMAVDLNRVLLTADCSGLLHATPQRRYFSFIDGIVGGQGNGPLSPDAYHSGVILAGANPLTVDWVATRLMGLNPDRIPMYTQAATEQKKFISGFAVEDIEVTCNPSTWNDLLMREEPIFRFATAPGWRGAIECYGSTGVDDRLKPASILQQTPSR